MELQVMQVRLLSFLVLCCCCWSCSCLSVNVSDVWGFTKLRSWKQSTLYRIESDAGYKTNPLLLQLVGSRYDMGYAYGYLLSNEISDAYFSLLGSLLGKSSPLDQALMWVVEMALDWQWQDYLSKEVPAIYKRELSGVSDGGAAQKCRDCGAYVTRVITLANAPGDVQDYLLIIVREVLQRSGESSPEMMKLLSRLTSPKHSMHCSMFAIWGSRSSKGELFSARNLDWNKDTGINQNKLVMVTVPNDGAIPSANLGFAGLYGTLAGMSAAGLTLHEANLEELQISFQGFPWVLRVRFIMEFARDLKSAHQLWDSTNNTVGFNHMIASAPDAALYRQNKTHTVALALETMYQYTAYFADNDAREAAALYTPSDGNTSVHIGFPLREAVWRTNHGYDPVIRQNYEWSQSPKAYSLVRYMLIFDALQYYHSTSTLIGFMEALNMTATVGDKGSQHPHQCLNNTDGSNVLSVTFLPEQLTLYSAWERFFRGQLETGSFPKLLWCSGSSVRSLMGNHCSAQFLRALRDGDATKALELYSTKKKQLMENLQPNQSLGSEHNHNTYLHYAAFYGMEDMYSELLSQKGKPDMKNSQRRNCVHLICMGRKGEGEANTANQDHSKHQMLKLTMTEGLRGMDLKHLLAEKDENGNTALHLAAGAGLKQCVELLLSYEADMVATNEDGLTPADLAKAKQQAHIATSLEAKMVFSCAEDLAETVEPDSELLEEIAEEPKGMHDTDLRSMKDTLLIETSEMLGVGLQSAEVLLKHYGWSKEELLGAWLEDAEGVCAAAGVDPPEGGGQDFLAREAATAPQSKPEETQTECGICCMAIDHHVLVPCDHHFCKDCWREYLEQKISRGDSQNISCPEYGCYKLVPLEVIEGIVSHDMASKFLSFDLKAFVDSNPNIRWCPHPDCSQAVNRPQPLDESSPSHANGEVKGQSVPCGSGHYFCWECLGECHEPCSCKQWQRWLEHCKEMKLRIGETTAAEVNEAASSKWMVDNSKPCPKCKSPIEKTEGCNHMCCKHCRHDFCWVCLDDWKCHNSSTGGYFNCNRYDAQMKAGQYLDERRHGVLKSCKDWEAMSKFLHYYERYKEHINSYQLEEPFLDKAQEKMIELAHSIQHLESRGLEGVESQGRHASVSVGGGRKLDLTFIQDAVQELLKCRRVLKASYCYGYYLTGIVSKKQFEHMQGALEQVTETLAEAVARPHLRKPRLEIIRLTREAREKRVGLVKNVHSGLPMATHPFTDTFGGSGLPLGTKRRFLRDLDTYTPAEARRGRGHRQDTDEDLMRVLEISRKEYEADKQMHADVELAKTLSMRLPRPPSPASPPSPPSPPTNYVFRDRPTSPVAGNWWDSLRSPRRSQSNATPTTPGSWLDSWIHSHSSSVDEPSWPVLKPATPTEPATPSPTVTPPERDGVGGQSPPPWVNAAEWGPVYGEDEDLHLAIQDSLKSPHTGHVTSLPTPTGHTTLLDRPKDMLVISYQPTQPSPHPQDQLVGYQHTQPSPHPQDQLVGHHVTSPTPQAEPANRDSTTLPSSLQQLLDSNLRIGTNV